MLPFLLLLAFLFLLWAFFLRTEAESLRRLGTLGTNEILQKKSFFYLSLHTALFRKKSVELLLFSLTLGARVAQGGFLLVLFFTLLLFTHLTPWGWILSLLLMIYLLLIVTDLFPLLLSLRAPQTTLRFFSPYTSLFLFLSFPFHFLLVKLAQNALLRPQVLAQPLEEMRETIVSILQSANIQGKLNSSDKKLLESVVQFKDLIVREAMIPRVDLFCLSATTTIRQAAHVLAKEGYSRVPVYRGTIDNVIGMLMYKDVLEIYMECEDGKKEWNFLNTAIETVAKSVFYTPETNKVSHLLQEFRAKQIHMAIVVDEYGGTAGVVTIEDILEEIVGDIADEYDEEEELLYTTQTGGGSWIVDGRMNIKDAEDLFAIEIPQEADYETIGGYLFHKLGSSPEKGMVIHHDAFDLEILSSTERSVEKVRITPHRPSEET